MTSFWNWVREDNSPIRTLHLNGTIAEESWFDDDITPALFHKELFAESGPITVKINSPGGDCIAAAQIYNQLKDYPGIVRIEIDGLAASAASVIAMAGDEVYMSPVSMLMIHNPMTMALGDESEMDKAKAMLMEIKESIINAYERKSHLSRKEISKLMDAETWMNANKAKELGFIDGILGDATGPAWLCSHRGIMASALGKYISEKTNADHTENHRTTEQLLAELSLLEKHL